MGIILRIPLNILCSGIPYPSMIGIKFPHEWWYWFYNPPKIKDTIEELLNLFESVVNY